MPYRLKVKSLLVEHVYAQTNIGMFASTFCAFIVFIGVYDAHADNTHLFTWGIFLLSVAVLRVILAYLFKHHPHPENQIHVWRNLYIMGAILGGISWGALGFFLLPGATPVNQTLMVLMAAGVTAGAIPLSAGIPIATIGFLLACILPFILGIALLENQTYLLFDIALTLYLFYTMILSMRAYRLIYNSTVLKFQNDILLADLEKTNQKLAQAATHDALTQLANRRLFTENLARAIEHAKKNKRMMALLYIDLDHFKKINDLYGHQTGDFVLLTVIEKLRNYFGKDEHIARLGGDELAIIIENVSNLVEVEMIADELCQLLAVPVRVADLNLKISASIGISVYPMHGLDEESLLKASDKFMYSVKNNGGNNFHLGKEMTDDPE